MIVYSVDRFHVFKISMECQCLFICFTEPDTAPGCKKTKINVLIEL